MSPEGYKGPDDLLESGINSGEKQETTQEEIDAFEQRGQKSRELINRNESINGVLDYLNSLKNPVNIDDKTEDDIIDLFKGKGISEINNFLEEIENDQSFKDVFSGMNTEGEMITFIKTKITGKEEENENKEGGIPEKVEEPIVKDEVQSEDTITSSKKESETTSQVEEGINNKAEQKGESVGEEGKLDISKFTPEYIASLDTSHIESYVNIIENELEKQHSDEYLTYLLGIYDLLTQKRSELKDKISENELSKLVDQENELTKSVTEKTIQENELILENKEIKKTIKQELEDIKKSLGSVVEKYPSIAEILSNINSNDKNLTVELGKVLDMLNNEETLTDIGRDLTEDGFKEFETAVTGASRNPGEKARFELMFDTVRLKLKEERDQPEKVVEETPTNFTTTVEDGKRTITSTNGGEKMDTSYSISTEENPEFSEDKKDAIKQEYSSEILGVDNEIGILGEVANIVEDLLSRGLDFDAIQTQLLKSVDMYPVDIQNVIKNSTDINSLKSGLVKVKTALEKNKKEIEEEQEEALAEFDKKKEKSYEQKDKKIKMALHLIDRSGFGLLGQSFIDNIFRILNNNPGLRAGLGLSRPIDLENGILGFSEIVSNAQRMILLGELFNGMLTGDKTKPISIDSLRAGHSGYGKNKEAIQGMISSTLVKGVSGNDYDKAFENLKKSQTETSESANQFSNEQLKGIDKLMGTNYSNNTTEKPQFSDEELGQIHKHLQ